MYVTSKYVFMIHKNCQISMIVMEKFQFWKLKSSIKSGANGANYESVTQFIFFGLIEKELKTVINFPWTQCP